MAFGFTAPGEAGNCQADVLHPLGPSEENSLLSFCGPLSWQAFLDSQSMYDFSYFYGWSVSGKSDSGRQGLEFEGIVHDVRRHYCRSRGDWSHDFLIRKESQWEVVQITRPTSSDPLLPARIHSPDVPQPSKTVLQAEDQVFKNKWVVVV